MKLILDHNNTGVILIRKDGAKEFTSHPTPESEKLLEEYGGFYEVSKVTAAYNREQESIAQKYSRFMEGLSISSGNYVIDSILATALTDEELMKLKLSIFEHEFVKNSTNRDVLTKIRTTKDPVDLIMYFGILRKEAND